MSAAEEIKRLPPVHQRAIQQASMTLDVMMKPHPEEEGEPTSDPLELAYALYLADELKVGAL